MATFQNLAATATTKLLATRAEEEQTWCTTAVPGPNGNVPVSACNAYYNYDPQFAPSLATAVIFGILTGVHVVEAFIFKKVSFVRPSFSLKYRWLSVNPMERKKTRNTLG